MKSFNEYITEAAIDFKISKMVSPWKAEELIAKLKQQGDVYEPGSKFIKIVKE